MKVRIRKEAGEMQFRLQIITAQGTQSPWMLLDDDEAVSLANLLRSAADMASATLDAVFLTFEGLDDDDEETVDFNPEEN